MQVKDLDHLGIIAGIIDQMQLEERVNESLGQHPQQKVSPGQGIKAMLLNGLGFVSAPLYLYEGFFQGKATRHLLGEGVEPEQLNDDYLGRLLDKVWEYGCSELFSVIAMAAYRQFGLSSRCYHHDSSSFSVQGEYAGESEEAGGIEIVHGYSKDQRPDLKQFIVELTGAGSSGVPLALTVSSGNQVDSTVFGERLKAVAQQFELEGILVADSALYSSDNLKVLGNLRWLTRVPLTLAAARDLVTDLSEAALADSSRPGYRLASVGSEYGGVRQLWVVVESQSRRQSDLKQLERQVEKPRQQAERQLRRQSKIDFNCAEDARQQAESLAAGWRYHHLTDLQVVACPHYGKAGRPKANAAPTHHTYCITAKVAVDAAALAQAQRRAGRFILATNAVDDAELTADQVLDDYKGQQLPERGFRFLKDPLFFTSGVFLKSPARIAALATVMGLALMVYALAERQLRRALAVAKETVLDQRRQPTSKPTLRWVFQVFQAVHLVVLDGQALVSNLTPERLTILRFLGTPCQQYYLTG